VTIQQVSNQLQLACRSFSSGNRNNPNSGISEDIAEKGRYFLFFHLWEHVLKERVLYS